MSDQLFYSISNLDGDELLELKQQTQGFSEERLQTFIQLYKSRRKDPQTGMILGIVPFVIGIHGINRFYYGNIGMGILYLLTFGLCSIGTIIDLINNKKMAWEANREILTECIGLSQHY